MNKTQPFFQGLLILTAVLFLVSCGGGGGGGGGGETAGSNTPNSPGIMSSAKYTVRTTGDALGIPAVTVLKPFAKSLAYSVTSGASAPAQASMTYTTHDPIVLLKKVGEKND
jgi:hypothetical protein